MMANAARTFHTSRIDSLVQEITGRPGVIELSAEWCGMCIIAEPLVRRLQSKMKGKVDFFQCDAGKSSDVELEYAVKSLPAFFLIYEGQILEILEGALPEKEFTEKLNQAFHLENY
jgi:thioredoxin-like negative regulator of GroEL